MNACPNCKVVLHSDHAFCPNCGSDLRSVVNEQKTQEAKIESNVQAETIISSSVNKVKEDFKTPFIISASFTTLSIFIWTCVFTNWQFSFDFFLNRLVNNSIWIMLVPYLISLFVKRQKRASLYLNMVLLFIGIGTILLFIGYSQMNTNQSPIVVRLQLRQPCIDNVIQQMEEHQISDEIKKLRAIKYCDCLLERINDDDMTIIGKREKEFWSIVTENYKDENTECVEISLQNN